MLMEELVVSISGEAKATNFGRVDGHKAAMEEGCCAAVFASVNQTSVKDQICYAWSSAAVVPSTNEDQSRRLLHLFDSKPSVGKRRKQRGRESWAATEAEAAAAVWSAVEARGRRRKYKEKDEGEGGEERRPEEKSESGRCREAEEGLKLVELSGRRG
ncbi:hypothetical protein Droror1_Dr00027553 [Drosera rotundifolia]